MLTRLLIVLLAILNVGVALWWLAPRAEPVAVVPPAEPGVASLEVLPSPAPGKVGPAAPVVAETQVPASAPLTAAPAPAAAAEAKPAALPPAAIAAVEAKPAENKPAEIRPPAVVQCASLGPYATQAQAQAAMSALGADAARPRLREVPGKAASSYRVLIAPAASREEAQATAKRIVEAGFSDYFIVSQGEEANAVALGQYRNREGAERRLASLTAAGFPAKLAASGTEIAPSWWVDTATAGAATPASLKQRAAAAQQQSLDCARLR
ncbi:SPOR domain-containing protein [Stenotrophomonas sp.]|uniref:SPOR domain-containing protein n=1 Tax=Stenotrophomonas sp. TaxID=69392 RepID=UPI0028A90BB6|nr:SPOR domain-containing protein [Stenotrophomonas sp.]